MRTLYLLCYNLSQMPVRESIYFLTIFLLIFLGLLAFLLFGFLAPIVIGFLLAGLAYPLHRWLTKIFRGRENLAAFTTVFAIALLIILPTAGILTLLTRETIQIVGRTSVQSILESPFGSSIQGIASRFDVDIAQFFETQLTPALRNFGLAVSKEIGGILSSTLQFGMNFFILAFVMFYFLRDGIAFGKFLINFSPLKTVDELTIYRTFRDTGLAVFYGHFAAAIAQGVLGGLGFAIFGVGAPILAGTAMAFLSLIPLLGPYLLFVPAALYLLLAGKTVTAIIFLLYNLLIVSTVDNLIRPEVISGRVRIHPLLVLLSIFGGLNVFGILGIIYGPLIAAVFLALLKVYLAHAKSGNPHPQF